MVRRPGQYHSETSEDLDRWEATMSRLVRSVRTVAVLASAALVLAAVPAVAASAAPAPAGRRLSAVIRRTTGGVPHILARDWPSLGYGYGFAFARDNLCTMANDYVTVEGQRSRYFGPSGSYIERGVGETVTNLDSDLFFRQIIDSRIVQRSLRGLSPQVAQIEAGYVRGYNRYLASVGGARGVPDPACRGQAWVRPITLQDSYLRFYQLMLMAGEGGVIGGIAQAAPPKTAAAGSPAAARPQAAAVALADPRRAARELAAGFRAEFGKLGSNAVAIGSAGTRSHHGLLLGNPHYPWIGPERFYQAQLTIPGKINVTGVSLYGVPVILIGHTATVAWSHTVSTAIRFTPYQLTLVPGHPTQYLQDGHPVAMTSRKVTVLVRTAGGRLAAYTRTLWQTRYGPVVNSLFGLPLPWTASTAFAIRDANATNIARALDTWFGFDRASSTRQMLTALTKYQGIPWVNTIVSDKPGLALYADIGTIPGVTNAEAAACDTALGAQTFPVIGLPILDGSRTACDWATGPGAAAPGLLGPGQEPALLRTDYVTNSNDSYWLANPRHPLTGFARIIGDEGTARTLRTRIGLIQVQARIDGTDGLGLKGFTLAGLQHLDLSDLDYAAVLTRPALVKMCRQFQAAGGYAPTSGGGQVRIGDACAILARWDLRWDVSQRGAVLFGAFWGNAENSGQSPFSHPFQLSDPVRTPYGLDTSSSTVRDALGDAISQLDHARIPLDATLGSVQHVTYRGARIPIPGGPGDPDGIYNAIFTDEYPGDSLTAPDAGSSFIQAVTWNDTPCPVGATILTYSESSNPASPHYADQTALFSHKKWLPDRFCQAQILADPHLQVTTVTSQRTPAAG
jgi:acyl-homoserine-lactone acylase